MGNCTICNTRHHTDALYDHLPTYLTERNINELLEDAIQLAREELERRGYERSTRCECLWKKGRRMFLCASCRERFPLYAAMFDK